MAFPENRSQASSNRAMSASSGRSVEVTPIRTRATAFDAARSGSWHYYSPQPRKQPISTNNDTAAGPSTSTNPPSTSTTTSTITQTFDAANPATWRRSDRVLPVSMLRPSLGRSISEDPGAYRSLTRERTSSFDPASRSLQEWNNYLSLGGVRSRERADILADVLAALRHEARETSAETQLLRRAAQTRPVAVPQRSTSILDDPDFGDTTVYWNSLSGVARASESSRPFGSNLTTSRSREQRSRLHTMTRPTMPRQPTHLNYDGLAPEQETVRRRPSVASISSLASRGSLPEYSAAILDGQHALPSYRARASTEIQV